MNKFTMQDALSIQAEHMRFWESILKPAAYAELLKICRLKNQNAREPRQVWRGFQITESVQNLINNPNFKQINNKPMERPTFNDARLGAQIASIYIALGKVEAIRFLKDIKREIGLAQAKNTIEYYIPNDRAAHDIIKEYNDAKDATAPTDTKPIIL